MGRRRHRPPAREAAGRRAARDAREREGRRCDARAGGPTLRREEERGGRGGLPEALAAAPPRWGPCARADGVADLRAAQIGRPGRLRDAAREAFPKLADTPSAANVASSGLDCALVARARASRPARSSSRRSAADGRSVVARPRAGHRGRRHLLPLRLARERARGGRRLRGPAAGPDGLVGVPRRAGRRGDDARGADGLRLAPPRRLYRARRAQRAIPMLEDVREGLSRGLQPARAPRARLRGHEELRDGARVLRQGALQGVRPPPGRYPRGARADLPGEGRPRVRADRDAGGGS